MHPICIFVKWQFTKWLIVISHFVIILISVFLATFYANTSTQKSLAIVHEPVHHPLLVGGRLCALSAAMTSPRNLPEGHCGLPARGTGQHPPGVANGQIMVGCAMNQQCGNGGGSYLEREQFAPAKEKYEFHLVGVTLGGAMEFQGKEKSRSRSREWIESGDFS